MSKDNINQNAQNVQSARDSSKVNIPNPRDGGPMGRGPLMMRGAKPKNFKATFKRLIKYLRFKRVSLIIMMVLAAASTVFSIFAPKILGRATTSLANSIMSGATVDLDYILQILIIVTGLYLASVILSFISNFLAVNVSQSVVYQMRKQVKEKLDKLPLKYFDSIQSGEILSRITNDIDTISTTLQQSVNQIISSAFTLVGILVMMITINIYMTLVALATLPIFILITVFIAKKSQKAFTEQQIRLSKLNGHVEEMYAGHRIIKLYGHEEKSIEKFEDINVKLEKTSRKAQFLSGIIFPALNFVNNLGYVGICIVGGIMAGRGVSIGDIQAFIQYSQQFSQPIMQTANIANILQSTMAAAEHVFELLDEKEMVPDKESAKTVKTVKGNVAFENVDFSYAENVELIKDMNINVKAGKSIAIVGPTGAGKTTLVNLLMRFYEINGGKIKIDDLDYLDFTKPSLRAQYGMVLQDTWLFSGTIAENIAYGKKDATIEEIKLAAKKAHIDHYIETLQDGYNTVLNEEANNISQGQKQLITIARAILKDPKILILDEATSSVDTRTEQYIQTAMTAMMKDKTSFVIAHRLSTIKNAALILVMDKGRVIEQGSHQELLDKKGFYAELYNSQFSSA